MTGGGPGAMEAPLLGAWFAFREIKELEDAIQILAPAPYYKDEYWLSKAFEVIEKFPLNKGIEILSMPTWLHGHEPSTPFATKIAKYFNHNTREDEGLLAIAKGGLVITPGNGGTILEIFREAIQNHNLLYDISSPMIFYGEEYWTVDRAVYPLIKDLSQKNTLRNLRFIITDKKEEIIDTIKKFSNENKIQNGK